MSHTKVIITHHTFEVVGLNVRAPLDNPRQDCQLLYRVSKEVMSGAETLVDLDHVRLISQLDRKIFEKSFSVRTKIGHSRFL